MLEPMNSLSYIPKDFIETAEGLMFAVVQQGTEMSNEQEKVLCFLRYIKRDYGNKSHWHKVTTDAANAYLEGNFPVFMYYSPVLDAHLHGVVTGRIVQHYRPRQQLQLLLTGLQRDEIEQDLYDLCSLFQQYGLDLSQVGVTGSLLVGAQKQSSDIDLVIYDRMAFHQARAITSGLIGKGQLDNLSDKDWQAAYGRRSCTLTLEEYVWHEQRKFNKGIVNGRKFDLSFVDEQLEPKPVVYQKCGEIIVLGKIIEDSHGFDYPAIFKIDHDTVKTIVCFTATYTGQAFIGETVEVSGLLEQADDGSKRIVVGSSREAPGEYIKVIQCPG
jgi:uncharacterized protein